MHRLSSGSVTPAPPRPPASAGARQGVARHMAADLDLHRRLARIDDDRKAALKQRPRFRLAAHDQLPADQIVRRMKRVHRRRRNGDAARIGERNARLDAKIAPLKAQLPKDLASLRANVGPLREGRLFFAHQPQLPATSSSRGRAGRATA